MFLLQIDHQVLHSIMVQDLSLLVHFYYQLHLIYLIHTVVLYMNVYYYNIDEVDVDVVYIDIEYDDYNDKNYELY